VRLAVAGLDAQIASWRAAGWTTEAITANNTYWFFVMTCR
jgi:hypothetical protein